MGRLKGKVALVTGAGRGIGQSVAFLLAREGARVVVNDLDYEPANDTVRQIVEEGGEAIVYAGSVTDIEFANGFVGAALSTYGDIHIIVNNAGYTWDAMIHKMTDEQFDAIIDCHLKAPWKILRAASHHFRERATEESANGVDEIRKVVNISSVAGSRGNPGQTNYASAKAAVIGLTKTLAKEWARYKVCVNAIAFGYIDTRLTAAREIKEQVVVDGNTLGIGMPPALVEVARASVPFGRPGTPEEAAGSVLLMCLPESNYVSGQLLEVTGGG